MTNFENLSVIDFAQQIRERPSMYFGNEIKITHLENMLWGFKLNSKKESAVPFQYFNYWVKLKLNKFGSIYNWKVAILEICNQDEQLAFWKFYELLDEFILLTPKKLFVADLSADNLSYYYSKDNTHKDYRIIGADNRYVLDPAPYRIKLFEFDYCVHSYHFDYFFVIDEYDKNIYYDHFDKIAKCKKTYKDKFNISKWQTIEGDLLNDEFKATTVNCRNRWHNII